MGNCMVSAGLFFSLFHPWSDQCMELEYCACDSPWHIARYFSTVASRTVRSLPVRCAQVIVPGSCDRTLTSLQGEYNTDGIHHGNDCPCIC